MESNIFQLIRNFIDCLEFFEPSERRANIGTLHFDVEPFVNNIVEERVFEKYIKQMRLYKDLETHREKFESLIGHEDEISKELSSFHLSSTDIRRYIKRFKRDYNHFLGKMNRYVPWIAMEIYEKRQEENTDIHR